MKEFTNVAGNVISFANFPFLSSISCTGAWFELFQKLSENIFTPKGWFLSKKRPKEGERVARGHFLDRVFESPVHCLPPGELPCCSCQSFYNPMKNYYQIEIKYGEDMSWDTEGRRRSQMFQKVEYRLPAKIWRLVGWTKMISWKAKL